MNKQDLSKIKRNFKVDSERFNISEIINVYCKVDGLKRVFHKKEAFGAFDEDFQESYINNFKKVITGGFDAKLFELDFNKDTMAEKQGLLIDILRKGFDEELVLKFVDDLLANYKYDTDVVVTFINANMFLPIKNKNDEKDDENDYSYSFIMCSINKVQPSNANLKLDVAEKEIKLEGDITTLNIGKPLDGFLYPAYTDDSIDVNNVLYYTGTANTLNIPLVVDVLGLNSRISAKEQKEIFTTLLTSTLGESVELSKIDDIYKQIDRLSVSEDEPVENITLDDIGSILKDAGVSNFKDVKDVLNSDFNIDGNTEFKIDNIIPKKKNSIKIKDGFKLETETL